MLKIETVGLEQYAPGGSARVQVLIVGGAGVGKTRMSSFFPRPLYADCEDGMASVADRGVDRVRIRNSRDMRDLLVLLKKECAKPEAQRKWDTLVVDTVDTFQRLVLEEWHEQHPNGTNNKYDIWNHLGRQMAMLTTRATNLDMNVVMLVHESNKEIDEVMVHGLQLKGGGKDEIFNDFDLVGWLRTEWGVDDEGERTQRRLLTFHPRPGREWLKDRLHVTPPELEVTFDESDYTQLFSAIVDRLDEFPETQVIGEVPDADTIPSPDVVAPEAVSGPLPPQAPPVEDLSKLKKAELLDKASELGVDVPAGALKAEVLKAVEAAVAQQAGGDAVAPTEVEPEVEAQPEEPAEEATLVVEDAAPAVADPEPDPEPEPEPAADVVVCEDCGVDLAGEVNQDLVRIGRIKYRAELCNKDFQARKNAS